MEKKCSQCDKVFWQKDALIRHEKSVHSKVKCVNCDVIPSSYWKDVQHRWSVTSSTTSTIKVKILLWSTWFFQQMVTFYASFWQVLLQSSNFFFFTFMKHFLQLYETKIHIFAIISTTKSSIKVKILIWSTWFIQQMVNFYTSSWQGLLQSSNLFFVHFYRAFLHLYENKIHICHNINH